MDPRQHQSQQRGNTPNTPHNQPANSHRHQGNQSQNRQTNSAGSYAGGPPVGASGYGQLNQQPVNTSQDHQPQGYINNMPVIDPYTHSPAGPEGGSGSIRQTSSNQRELDRNAARMAQQVAPALQQSYSSRGSAPGRHGDRDASSQQPSQASYVGPGNTASLHNVQEQHRYVHGAQAQVQPPARDMAGSSGISRPNYLCKIPYCRQQGYVIPQIQEQLDYCEAHLVTALEGFAAVCNGCRRFPVLANSDYCSRFCAGGGRSAATAGVPQGFAPACQECRRPITENMQIYGGHFCSPECWNAYLSARSSGR